MNIQTLVFLVVCVTALVSVPRRWAAVPLVVGACYMSLGQGISVGPFYFTVLRLLILGGVCRVLVRGERIEGGMHVLDKVLLAWSGWALFSSVFHSSLSDALVFRSGLVFNTAGIYFLIRIFCRSVDDIRLLLTATAFILVPVAIEMINAQITGRNLFSMYGGVPEVAVVRDGRIRSQGPFGHPILAGSVGAGCLPIMVGLWRRNRAAAIGGLAASVVMVIASASSGPVMSMLVGICAVFLWKYREHVRAIRWTALCVYVLLDLVMKAPAYYLMARISSIGGGYHRARLIESSFKHLNEWWLAGTDYTRHWMVTGVSWSPDHTDITNHYIKQGVIGGLPLMSLFIAGLGIAFAYFGNSIKSNQHLTEHDRFLVWTLGASLFAYAATCLSVAFFDQSFMFLYLLLAIAGALRENLSTHSEGANAPDV